MYDSYCTIDKKIIDYTYDRSGRKLIIASCPQILLNGSGKHHKVSQSWMLY